MNKFLTVLVLLGALAITTQATIASSIKDGQLLQQGYVIKAPTQPYYAEMRSDGNFVVYNSATFSPSSITFSSQTTGMGQAPYSLVLQTDGNMVIYDGTSTALWATFTNTDDATGWILVMQDDGNLVLYDGSGQAQWDSLGGMPSNAHVI